MMARRVAVLLVWGALFASPPPRLEAQCAMCRTALESSERGKAMAEKFNQGILFLLGAPFTVVGLISVAMLRSRKRACLSRSS